MKKKIIVLCSILILLISGCSKENKEDKKNMTSTNTKDVTNFVKIEVEDFGDMVLELYPDIAPITVKNFQKLVSEKFYDGLTFHRVVKGFMIQGGAPSGDSNGGAKETIKGEFSANGVKNNLSHERGVISMARNSISMDSASSQFFICHADSKFLDGQYAAFGKVIEGFDTLDKIASVKVNGETPVTKPVIKSITFVNVDED